MRLPIILLLSLCAAILPGADPGLPPGCGTYVIVEDLPGHLRTLLGSPAVRRYLGQGAIAELLAEQGQTPESILAALDEAGSGMPVRIAVGVTDAAWRDLDHLLGFGMRLGLLSAADDFPEDPALADVRAESLALLRALRLPPLCIALDFAEPATGQQIAMVVGGAMQSIGCEPRRVGDATAYRTTLGDVLDDLELRTIAVAFALDADAESPEAHAFADAIAALALEVTVRTTASGVVLTCGAWPADAAPTVAPRDAAAFVSARWDIATFARSLTEAWTWWSRWEGTALGGAAAARDTQDMAGTLRRLARQIGELAATGEATLVCTSDGFTLEAIGSPRAPASGLAECGLAGIDLGEPAYVDHDAGYDPARWIGDQLTQLEERLDQQSLKATVRGDDDREEAIEAMIEAYHQRFAELRALTMDEHADYFLPGLVVVSELDARIDVLEVTERQRRRRGVRIAGLPVPALALIGRPKSADLGRAFVDRLALATVGPLYRLGGKEPPAALTHGFATPGGLAATGFDAGWIQALAADWTIRIDGGGPIHAATHEGWLILSSSPVLTDRIRAALAGGGHPAWLDGEAYHQGLMEGGRLAQYLRELIPLVRDPQRMVGINMRTFSDRERVEFVRGLTMVADGAALLGRITWSGRNEGDTRRFVWRAPLVMPAAGPAGGPEQQLP